MKKVIKEKEWIKIKSSQDSTAINGYVLKCISNELLSVGYMQNNAKGIKEDIIWNGSFWQFKYNNKPIRKHFVT